jgi:hypothetical protein
MADRDQLTFAVHLGAHKTATTYVQATLDRSREPLRECGVANLPLREMRATLTRAAWWPKEQNDERARRAIADLRGPGTTVRRIVLSDENLLGTPGNLPAAGTYDGAAARVGRLGELLAPLGSASFYLAVRSYETFAPSMYTETIRHRPFLTFDEYRRAVGLDAFSWRTVLDDVCEAIGGAALTVWRYEDFGELHDRVFGALAPGVPADRFDTPSERVRQSASGQAVQALEALRSVLGPEQVQQLVRPVVGVADGPAFRPFGEHEAGELRERYHDDLREARRDRPEVTWLAPEASPAGDDGRSGPGLRHLLPRRRSDRR